ncbi:MAG: hypothetical protein MUF53_13355 [Gemmatimonadaceae bacterium]|nr:hypothetical protein [Gemmatimonadaceae bacterium]
MRHPLRRVTRSLFATVFVAAITSPLTAQPARADGPLRNPTPGLRATRCCCR